MNTRKYPRSTQEAFKDAEYANPFPGNDPWFQRRRYSVWGTVKVVVFVVTMLAVIGGVL